ncbi:hypothetical protein [Streptomyces malaysiensis]|uniref:hypothetical protein n=1 Tax=Streptomyces malaysiensis TaxID=92644 RepID=UPI0036AD24E8
MRFLPGVTPGVPRKIRRNTTADDTPRLRALLHRLTTVDGAPGALAEVRNRRGGAVLTSGVANVSTHAPIHRDSRFRIGGVDARVGTEDTHAYQQGVMNHRYSARHRRRAV